MKNKKLNITISLNPSLYLTTLFIILKLLNVISWSWWWIYSPLWIIPLIAITIFIIWTTVGYDNK